MKDRKRVASIHLGSPGKKLFVYRDSIGRINRVARLTGRNLNGKLSHPVRVSNSERLRNKRTVKIQVYSGPSVEGNSVKVVQVATGKVRDRKPVLG